mgnify:CR=1 FL=1
MIELEQNDILEETEYDAIDLDEEELGDSAQYPGIAALKAYWAG